MPRLLHRVVHVFKGRHPPPSQEELDASMTNHGLLRINHPQAFYGNAADVPHRATIFAGQVFHVPTSATGNLSPFRGGNATAGPFGTARLAVLLRSLQSNGQQLCRADGQPDYPALADSEHMPGDGQGREQRPVYVMVPARPAPSPPHIDAWLTARRGRAAAAANASLESKAGRGSGFTMDANTGKLVPLYTDSQASEEGQGGSLLGTPGLCTAPNATPRDASQPEVQQTPAQQEEEEVRPASPKYDERNFFYTTPRTRTPVVSTAALAAVASSQQGAPPGDGDRLGPGGKAGSPSTSRKRVAFDDKGSEATAGQAAAVEGPASSFKGSLSSAKRRKFVSQITPPSPAAGASGPTPLSQAGFKRLVAGKGQQLTLLSVEVHADCRGSLLPDPRYDAALDPDIVLGFEVQKGSLGYLADRAATMDKPLLRQISRLPETFSMKEKQHDEYGTLHASGIHVTGRIVLNLWRILRSELKLNIYTFESCVAAVLQLRTPHVPSSVLAQWFKGGPGGGRWRCIRYWVTRARLNLAMMEQLDLVGRTGEMARAFGIDFFSVLTRGSQYRVESMLLRLAHTQNYLLLSASKEQVAQQPAMECIPLVMEPESRFYTSPVVVLDFQSLYPSMIIAYNLCYSTCVGRPAHSSNTGESVKLGAASLLLPKGSLAGPMAPDRLIVAPNGVAYVAPEARKGVVPRLLREILETRIMVKAAMKRAPASAKVLQRVLNARQFSLKLIANVTYGYAAAGFSGRMPMAELADSIVQSGRQTLENAIRMVEANQEWKARVVYGDTDSMFVLLPGRSREEAHKIGAEIASAVTAANPPPVTLKMEKVYHPCVLLSKKRYVGAMYEAPGQTVPDFDAKGIETVRRDTCPAVAKMMERSLRLLFNTRDLSEVKSYLERQWSKILANRISIQDFIFAKEVRLGTYSPKAPVVPPAAIVAGKAMAADPRAEPRFGERVPYIVVYGEPGARLVDMVVSPHALVESQGRLRLHSIYYITKAIIPALERVFSLMGADLRQWFAALPRPSKLLPQKRPAAALPLAAGGRTTGAGTIDQYYLSRHCAVCDGLTHAAKPLCQACRAAPQFAAAVLTARSARLESQHVHLVRVCLHCSSGGGRNLSEGGVACDSLDCGVFFERRKVSHELAAALALRTAGLQLLQPLPLPQTSSLWLHGRAQTKQAGAGATAKTSPQGEQGISEADLVSALLRRRLQLDTPTSARSAPAKQPEFDTDEQMEHLLAETELLLKEAAQLGPGSPAPGPIASPRTPRSAQSCSGTGPAAAARTPVDDVDDHLADLQRTLQEVKLLLVSDPALLQDVPASQELRVSPAKLPASPLKELHAISMQPYRRDSPGEDTYAQMDAVLGRANRDLMNTLAEHAGADAIAELEKPVADETPAAVEEAPGGILAWYEDNRADTGKSPVRPLPASSAEGDSPASVHQSAAVCSPVRPQRDPEGRQSEALEVCESPFPSPRSPAGSSRSPPAQLVSSAATPAKESLSPLCSFSSRKSSFLSPPSLGKKVAPEVAAVGWQGAPEDTGYAGDAEASSSCPSEASLPAPNCQPSPVKVALQRGFKGPAGDAAANAAHANWAADEADHVKMGCACIPFLSKRR
ncbi:hypothetical protein WJX72_006119 [[Myrmecia] bisecta]|uniref:DNA polymerase n=1 Tax=[Myrmecia] bisecta TaxID=41462 RepID=A0AAW1R7G6_9CHLO